jgi:hypothetical protein
MEGNIQVGNVGDEDPQADQNRPCLSSLLQDLAHWNATRPKTEVEEPSSSENNECKRSRSRSFSIVDHIYMHALTCIKLNSSQYCDAITEDKVLQNANDHDRERIVRIFQIAFKLKYARVKLSNRSL